ncbi:MAG TPA: TonB-dependent receptor, partial [Hellea balneolensis]|nr:TonB-dependent receptor [Hellea balneolensis]
MTTSKLLTTLLCSTAMVAAGFSSAYAQDSGADTPEVINNPPAQVAENDQGDNIIVTGSRIKKNTFSNSVPIDVLTVEEATLEGIGDVGALLQTATVASGSPQVTAATSAEFVQNGGLGAATISLRGLGANRTLSLVNGRRAGPSGTRGQVSSFDLNTLPAVAIERVEILKDGASTIYGSDAVAGVVNFILRTDDYKGVDGFVSIPEQSGGEEIRFSGTWGETFDRGRLRITGDYYKQVEMARGDRDYYSCAPNYVFNADGSGRRADVIDPRTGEPQCIDLLWGHVWVYDYGSGNRPLSSPSIVQYDYDGSLAANGLSPYPNQGGNGGANIATPANWYPVYYDQNDITGLADWNGITVGTEARGLTNGDHPFQDRQSLVPGVERITLMGSGEIDISNTVQGYAEALYNRRTTKLNNYRQFWTYVYGENAFGAVNTTPTAQGWTGGAQWYSPTAITEFADSTTQIDYFRLVGGLRGEFSPSFGKVFDGWSWDAHLQYSNNSGDYTNDFIRNDSIRDNFFALSSCVGTTSSVAGLPCVDIPWFDPQFLAGNIDQASKDFLFTTETGNTKYTQLSG